MLFAGITCSGWHIHFHLQADQTAGIQVLAPFEDNEDVKKAKSFNKQKSKEPYGNVQ